MTLRSPVRHARITRMTAKLKCAALKCREKVPSNKLLCDRHWKMVPKDLKEMLVDCYTLGQETARKMMSAAFRDAVIRIVKDLADREGVTLSHEND